MKSSNQLFLLGKSLEHSFSKQYFTSKFELLGLSEWSYSNFELDDIQEIELLKTNPNLIGFNVTIPYKSTIIPFLDDLDGLAKDIGAVNTVKCIKRQNEINYIGFNTDQPAIIQTLIPYMDNIKGAMVLGSGGASKAVISALKHLNIDYKQISRSGPLNYSSIERRWYTDYNLIINCTPLGMFPDVDTFPNIVYTQLNSNSILYDLVYNPEETQFLIKGKENDSICLNGMKMLEIQADLAFNIWTNTE